MEVARVHLEACSRITYPTTHVPGEQHPSEQVASVDGSAIHTEKQTTDVKHAEMKVDGAQNTKIGEEVTSPRGKKKSISLMGKRKMGSDLDSVCDCSCMIFKSVYESMKPQASPFMEFGPCTLVQDFFIFFEVYIMYNETF